MFKKILITGAEGFIGKNLRAYLTEKGEYEIFPFDLGNSTSDLDEYLLAADFIFHLAGVNLPSEEGEFISGNVDLTDYIIRQLTALEKNTPVVFTSSIQAVKDNPYGRSKLAAENLIRRYRNEGGQSYIYRLQNVFGKWCRPDYNSVVATFCHRIARNEEIQISDPMNKVELIYIDDIIHDFSGLLESSAELNHPDDFRSIKPSYIISLGELSGILATFKNIRKDHRLPDLSDSLTWKLHSTFVSYLPPEQLSYEPELKTDDRGNLFELFKSEKAGQVFISTTKKGITRGNHYHHSKVEKFCVINGEARIALRKINSDEIHEYQVSGEKPTILDIPPGYTHSIENTGRGEMICLFWANEVFNPETPDTYYNPVE